MLVSRPGRFNLSINDFFLIGAGLGQGSAVDVDNSAAPDKTKPSFLSNPINGGVIDMILQASSINDILRHFFRSCGPIGR